jgi:L-ascorbate metabolism protein UlaG (beta-lactamase superfamily)
MEDMFELQLSNCSVHRMIDDSCKFALIPTYQANLQNVTEMTREDAEKLENWLHMHLNPPAHVNIPPSFYEEEEDDKLAEEHF